MPTHPSYPEVSKRCSRRVCRFFEPFRLVLYQGLVANDYNVIYLDDEVAPVRIAMYNIQGLDECLYDAHPEVVTNVEKIALDVSMVSSRRRPPQFWVSGGSEVRSGILSCYGDEILVRPPR